MAKIWTLRRMRNLDLEAAYMFDTYIKEIRSVLELAVPAWHSGLTQKQSEDIERIQKTAFKIILGDSYYSYEIACTILESETLKSRREKLCLKFARKDVKSEKTLFNVVKNPPNTRIRKNIVHEFNFNNFRFRDSSLPYLSRLLNQNS